MISVFGLGYGSCDIRKAPSDPEAAKPLVVQLKKEGELKQNEGTEEIIKQHMYCRELYGDRSLHWSPDCWILKGCLDDKGLQLCYECSTFPHERRSEQSREREHRSQALTPFKEMKEKYRRTGSHY